MEKYKRDITKFIQNLIRIPSVNGENTENEIVNLIAKEAKRLELPYQIIKNNDDHPNIFVGEEFNKKSGLLLIAHTDTASIGDTTKWKHDPFSGTIDGSKIFGRGSIDCKSGIALSLYLLRVLKDEGKPGLAKFAGVSDEERGADSPFGAKYLLDIGLNAKAAIYTYSGNDTVTIGHRGQIKLWIDVTGESVHSGSRGWQDGTKGASAIEALNKFLLEVGKIKLLGTHIVFPGYKFKQTVVFIEGGSISGMVPDKARALLDARLLPNHSGKAYIKLVESLAKKFETEKVKFKITIQTNLPAAFISPREKIAKLTYQHAKKVLGTTPEIRGCGPANEGYRFINAGIPTICGFGVGGENAHSANEYVDIESLFKTLEIYKKVALEL